MNNLINFRKSVMRLIKMFIVASITFAFVQTWVTNYTVSLFSRDGNYVVIFAFVFLLTIFCSLYGAFKVGINRIHELIYSFSLSILITNFLMYLMLSLIAREMLVIAPLLISVVFQFCIAFVGCVCANTVYFKLYPARRLVAIFGDDATGFNLINRMSHIPERFKIERGVNVNSTSINDIKNIFGINITILKFDLFSSLLYVYFRNGIVKYILEKRLIDAPNTFEAWIQIDKNETGYIGSIFGNVIYKIGNNSLKSTFSVS